MRIQHNLNAMNAHRQLGVNTGSTGKNLEKLSSGFRINRAGDDAAGLAISEKMRGQIRGLAQAQQNAQDGISLIQTAEGGLNETHAILQKMRKLANQSANGTYQNPVDRQNLNKELEALKSEVDRISTATHYNKINLLDGNLGGYGVTGGTLATGTADFSVTGGSLQAGSIKGIAVSTNGDVTLSLTNGMMSGSVGGITVAFTAANFEIDASSILDNTTGLATFTLKAKSSATKAEIAAFDGLTLTVVAQKTADGKYTAVKDTDTATISATKSGLDFQIGANGKEDQIVNLKIGDMSSKGLGIGAISVGTQKEARDAIEIVDNAVNKVSGTRADLGALQNRLEHTVSNLAVTEENLTAAESRIRDVDMAKEMMDFTKNNILTQAAQAMLAQANMQPQGVLQLLQ